MLGRFEEQVLMALVAAKGEATTTDICDLFEKAFGKEPSYGALYTCLDRMFEKKYILRRRGAAEAKRGGKARWYFQISGGGRQALIEASQHQEILRGQLAWVGG